METSARGHATSGKTHDEPIHYQINEEDLCRPVHPMPLKDLTHCDRSKIITSRKRLLKLPYEVPHFCKTCESCHIVGKPKCSMCAQTDHSTRLCPYRKVVPAGIKLMPNVQVCCRYCKTHVCYLGSLVRGYIPPGRAKFNYCGFCYNDDHHHAMCPSRIDDILRRGSNSNFDPDKGDHAFYVRNLPAGVNELKLFSHFLAASDEKERMHDEGVHFDRKTYECYGYMGAIKDVVVSTNPNTGELLGFLSYEDPHKAAEAFAWGDGSELDGKVIECIPLRNRRSALMHSRIEQCRSLTGFW